MAYLTDDERQQMRQAILDRFKTESADSQAITDAQDSADTSNMIAGIGQSLEGIVRANSMARDGQGVNNAVYDAIRRNAENKVKSAKDAKNSKLDVLKTEGGLVKDMLQSELEEQRLREDADLRRQTEERMARIAQGNLDIAKDQLELDKRTKVPQFVGPNNTPVAEIKKDIEDLSTKQNTKASIRSEIAAGIERLNDPDLPEAQKLQTAQGMIKTLNSTQGADAIGAEEAARLASELETSIGGIAKFGAGGASAGAATGGSIGAALGSLAGGVGAIPAGAIGAGIGSVVGGIGGALTGAYQEAQKPGGLKMTPDVAGFTKRAEGTLDIIDRAMSKTDKIIALRRQGISTADAVKMVDAEAKKDFIEKN